MKKYILLIGMLGLGSFFECSDESKRYPMKIETILCSGEVLETRLLVGERSFMCNPLGGGQDKKRVNGMLYSIQNAKDNLTEKDQFFVEIVDGKLVIRQAFFKSIFTADIPRDSNEVVLDEPGFGLKLRCSWDR